MLFTKCIAEHPATDVITYKLMAHSSNGNYIHSYSIWKVNIIDGNVDKICRSIKCKMAVNMIWGDVINGLQK